MIIVDCSFFRKLPVCVLYLRFLIDIDIKKQNKVQNKKTKQSQDTNGNLLKTQWANIVKGL